MFLQKAILRHLIDGKISAGLLLIPAPHILCRGQKNLRLADSA